MTKLLFLHASPHRHGNVSAMLEAVRSIVPEGTDVTELHVDDLHIRPCRGCMSCRSQRDCVLPADDGHRVARLLSECDGLVIATPCYWGNIPGTLKLLLDRLVYALIGENKHGIPTPLHHDKPVLVLTACTTKSPFHILFHQSRGTVRALKEVFRWSGFRPFLFVEATGTHTHQVSPKVLEKCRREGRKFVEKAVGKNCRISFGRTMYKVSGKL